ncbi:MAG: hypothetical protein JWQ25_1890 [Daejeonella sp.]|nr:hypothetical protein [Daejeonella sp.]
MGGKLNSVDEPLESSVAKENLLDIICDMSDYETFIDKLH